MINNRDSLKKNRLVRSLAFHFRNWRESRSYTTGSGHSIERKGVCVNSKIQFRGGGSIIPFCSIKIQYSSRVESRSTGITIVSSYTPELTCREWNSTLRITTAQLRLVPIPTSDITRIWLVQKMVAHWRLAPCVCSRHTCRFAQATVTLFSTRMEVASIQRHQLLLMIIAG